MDSKARSTWAAPNETQLRIYNVLTVLLSLPCCYVFMRMILNGFSKAGMLDGAGMLVGASWMLIPILSLAAVALANFPSVGMKARAWLSSTALAAVLLLAAVPLSMIFWL